MSEDARGRVRAGGNLLEVGAADTAGVHADEELTRPDLRHGNGLQANIINAAIDGGLHGRRKGMALDSIAELRCDRH